MANKHRGFVEVELDKKRTIRFTMNAMAEIEDKLGVSLEDMGDIKMSIKNVRTILWAGLIHEDPELTEQEVGDMVDMNNMEYVQEQVALAFGGGGKND